MESVRIKPIKLRGNELSTKETVRNDEVSVKRSSTVYEIALGDYFLNFCYLFV